MNRTSNHLRRAVTAILPLFIVGVLAGCSDDPSGPSANEITAFFNGVSAQDGSVSASHQSGAAPAASGGPSASLTSAGSVINGGSSLATLTGNNPFLHVIVAIEEIDGFYQLTFSSERDTARVVINLGSEIPQETFNIMFGLMDASGNVGSYVSNNVEVAQAGTGELQISVSWDAASDVDLHVTDPNGEHVYFADQDPYGDGSVTLDLDSNAGCSIDGVNNENITWATQPPAGEYIVEVDYWSDCGVAETNYVVTVNIPGQQQETFSGSFTGDSSGYSIREITRFTLGTGGLSFR